MADDIEVYRPPQAWDQLDEESPEAYQAFHYYAGLPVRERSIVRVCDDLYRDVEPGECSGLPAHGRITTWSRDHRWIERAKAYDRWLYEESRKESLQARLEEERKSWEERARFRAQIKRIADKALTRAHDILATDPESKDLRDAVLAAERAANQLLDKAFEGMRDAYQVEPDQAEDMDPDTAAEIQALLAREAEKHLGTLAIEARRP